MCDWRGAAAAGLAGALLCAPLQAAAGSTQGIATIRVRDSLRVMTVEDLDFGRIFPDSGAGSGSITIAPDGFVSTSGGVVAVSGAHPAVFNIKRRIGRDYLNYLGPDGTDTIVLTSRTNPAHTMQVTAFTTDFQRRGGFGLPAYFFSTDFDFRVGGRLTVPPNQPPGSYVGTFRVEIAYQ